MDSVPLLNALSKVLPVAELHERLHAFLAPLLRGLPEKRLRAVAVEAVQGILAAHSPLVSRMAAALTHREESPRATAERLYRWLWNERFSHRDLTRALYALAQRIVARYRPAVLLVAVDPVNFEKPYTEALEGVSTVYKATPPGPGGEKRLTPGYPAITATLVNLPEPAISYAAWFSYQADDFVSENAEIYRAIRTTRRLFPRYPLRFLGDAGLDDQKAFRWAAEVGGEFIVRASHRERLVEIHNPRLGRWEQEHLGDLVDTVPLPLKREVAFTHAHRTRQAQIQMGWFTARLPGEERELGVVVAREEALDRDLVLLTNVPLPDAQAAQEVYTQWRFRPQIEHTYRFDQEQGLDVEDLRVRTLERMRRVFVLVLWAALFVYHVGATWSAPAVRWLCLLGGQLTQPGTPCGPYLLLAGISMVLLTMATATFAAAHPFPRASPTCE